MTEDARTLMGGQPIRNIRILIVDHDPETRPWGVTFDRIQGALAVPVADSFEAALQRANQFMLEVVFMDVHIPELGGIEAAKAIRRRQPATRVILLTTDERQTGMVDGIQAGVSGYLMKDADAHELAAAGRVALADTVVIDPPLMPMFTEEVRRSGLAVGVLPDVETRAWLNPRWRRVRELPEPQLRQIFEEVRDGRVKPGGSGVPAGILNLVEEYLEPSKIERWLGRIIYNVTRMMSDEEFARLVRTAENS